MSLSRGTGPLAGSPAGEFNFDLDAAAPMHRIYFAHDQRRIRALFGDAVILDTTRAALLYETGIAPRIYAPLADYALDRHFTPTDSSTHCPFKGDASYWTLKVGGREVADILWAYTKPLTEAAFLEGYGALYPDKPDAWFVEDDRVFGHLKDPFHRVDVHDSSRSVVVNVGGVEVARTARPKLLFETGLPVRAYIPPDDVAADLVRPSNDGFRTVCPYKGEASYWTINGVERAAWSYESPLPDALRAAGHLSFDPDTEGVEVTLGQG
jgi:uncharacterized protein (DUF427 family)